MYIIYIYMYTIRLRFGMSGLGFGSHLCWGYMGIMGIP